MNTPAKPFFFVVAALGCSLAALGLSVLPACASAGYARGNYSSVGEPASASRTPQGGTFVDAGENAVISTLEDRFSTFSVDVDTASWMYTRRFLEEGSAPNPAAVRVEELVNALHYDYAGPAANEGPVAVHVAAAPSPFASDKHVVRVALQSRRVTIDERTPATLTFLVDVSGSMDEPDKLPWVREGLHMAVDALRPVDRVAIVTYAGATRVVLPATTASDDNKRKIHAAIDELDAGGGTFMSSGMQLAYREAVKELASGARNSRVFVLSDGDANIGTIDGKTILDSIKGYVAEGVTMSTMGFGTGNYNDALMEQLADAGNGNYTYIGDKDAMKRFFVDDMTSQLEVVAGDAKIQVEWNPDVVASYRLLGYENRKLADADFKNDKKDAGEIGAGHAVTALYEVTLAKQNSPDDLGTVHVRYKLPHHSEAAAELTAPIAKSAIADDVDGLDADAQAALGIALGAEILRGDSHAAGLTLVDAALLLKKSARGPHADERTHVAELFLKNKTVAAR